jgi:hypothetical protein
VIRIRFCYEPTLPEVPTVATGTARPAETAAELSRNVAASPDVYANYLRTDSQAHGVNPPDTLETMSRVFVYTVDAKPQVLEPGTHGITAAGLRLRLVIQDIGGALRRQMLLEIENTTDDPLAYRVVTRPSKGTKPCHAREVLPHNAIVIAPHAVEVRSECIYRDGWTLGIESVETIRLPELGAIYVSWISPTEIGLDPRTSAGHQPIASGKTCDRHHVASVQRALERGEISWRDLAEFYARHRCSTYNFQNDYRAFKTDAERPLPVATMSY